MNFYRGMGLLTKSEEKQFSKEQEVLTLDSDEGTEEENDVQAKEPPQRTARGPVWVNVVIMEDELERRLAKR